MRNTEWLTNRSICFQLRRQTNAIMAARKAVKKRERLLAALNSMAGDGLSIPSEDTRNFVALIDEYFDDESGSEVGEEVRLRFALLVVN